MRGTAFEHVAIKFQKTEIAIVQAIHNEAGDQEPRYDEENVHPDKSGRNQSRASVECDNGEDGNGAQTVYVRPVGQFRSSGAVQGRGTPAAPEHAQLCLQAPTRPSWPADLLSLKLK